MLKSECGMSGMMSWIIRAKRIRRPFFALTDLNAQPYLARFCLPATDLIWELRSDLWGLFRLLVQSGRAMKFSGTAGVVGGNADDRNRH